VHLCVMLDHPCILTLNSVDVDIVLFPSIQTSRRAIERLTEI
jgi:hypothetical protein